MSDKPNGTFMGIPLYTVPSSREGFAMYSTTDRDAPTEMHHIVSWSPTYGIREIHLSRKDFDAMLAFPNSASPPPSD